MKSKSSKNIIDVQGETVNITEYRNPTQLATLLQKPALEIAKVLTGAVATGKSGMAVSVGRIAQGALQGNMIRQIVNEVEELKQLGAIKRDFYGSKYGFQSFADLLMFIEESTPDEEVFNAVKTLFYAINLINEDEKQQAYYLHLMRILQQLSSAQISMLSVSYDLHKNVGVEKIFPDNSHKHWLKVMAKEIKYNSTSLVEIEERKLIDLNLLTKRYHADLSGITPANARLTDLGMEICTILDEKSFDQIAKTSH